MGLAFVSIFLSSSQDASAQRIALKTNALEYLILSPNLTLEASLNRKFSLQLGLSANPITRPIGDFRLTNFRVEPEFRYWFNRPMARHFMALSFTAGAATTQFGDHFWKGDFVTAGVSYGYAIVLGRHWNMEAEIGVGVGTFRGTKYKGKDNNPHEINYSKVLPVPVRAALTFGYIFR